jgi:hypothetical protein
LYDGGTGHCEGNSGLEAPINIRARGAVVATPYRDSVESR